MTQCAADTDREGNGGDEGLWEDRTRTPTEIGMG